MTKAQFPGRVRGKRGRISAPGRRTDGSGGGTLQAIQQSEGTVNSPMLWAYCPVDLYWHLMEGEQPSEVATARCGQRWTGNATRYAQALGLKCRRCRVIFGAEYVAGRPREIVPHQRQDE